MRKLIVANWKENPSSEKKALSLFWAIAKIKNANADIVVCPPFLYLEEIAGAYRKMKSKSHLAIGAQDIFWEERGAFTSEVGPKMIRSLGAKYVIVGHSERRKYMHETDAMINKKIKLALKDGLNVTLCVGEPLSVRKKGITAARNFIKNQLKKDLSGLTPQTSPLKPRLTIAYEPIWAIGTGKNDNPEDAAEIANFIKRTLKPHPSNPTPRILYGGSVSSKNVRDFVRYNGIDGALVGGASLKAGEFKKLINSL